MPQGTTNFRFTAAGLEFDAMSYNWLIISGASARYAGEGIVKGGAQLYKFMVTVWDASESDSGAGPDGFRIKIWRETSAGNQFVLYDNGLGVAENIGNGGVTSLNGGSIIVHTSGKK